MVGRWVELTTPKHFLSYLARGESAAKLQNENTRGKKKGANNMGVLGTFYVQERNED